MNNKNNLYANDIDLDTYHKINSLELNSWMHQLNFIKIDLENLIEICIVLNEKNFIEELKTRTVENDYLLNKLLNYSSNRTNLIECEDIHCDIGYISEHKNLKKIYINHLIEYQNLKNDILKDTILKSV